MPFSKLFRDIIAPDAEIWTYPRKKFMHPSSSWKPSRKEPCRRERNADPQDQGQVNMEFSSSFFIWKHAVKLMPLIPALENWSQANSWKFKASLGYTLRAYLKKTNRYTMKIPYFTKLAHILRYDNCNMCIIFHGVTICLILSLFYF